jgi:hypothetical protein
MTDFAKALKKGLDAHKEAAAARAEVNAVIADFAGQVSTAMGGAVEIKLEELSKPDPDDRAPLLPAAIAARRYVSYLALVAIPKGEPQGAGARASRKVLCEVSFASMTSPVTLKYADGREASYDRASFEMALAKLLEHPKTGKSIMAAAGVSVSAAIETSAQKPADAPKKPSPRKK